MLPQFQTPSLVLGLFLRKLEVRDFRNFAESLPWRLPEFDAEPAFARVPENAPPHMIRVRFTSRDTRQMLEIAPAKVHFRMMPGPVKQTERGPNVQTLAVSKAYEEFIPQAMRIHTVLAEHFGATAFRMGIVTEIIAPVPGSVNQRMQKHLLGGQNLFGERLQELQIQASSRVQLKGNIGVNRRITARPFRTNQPGNPDVIFSVNVDLTSVAEEAYDISTVDMEHFLRGAVHHLEHEIPLLSFAPFFS